MQTVKRQSGMNLAHKFGVACVILVVCAVARNANAGPCEGVARAAFNSCFNEAREEFWIAIGNARNLPTVEERIAAHEEARAELREKLAECGEQLRARYDFCDALEEVRYNPLTDPANFDTPMANPFFPLVPGVTRVYEGETEDGTETVMVTVTDETREILGIECTVVVDIVLLDGEEIENTRDYYAADNWGTVWYFGENSYEVEDGLVANTEGSWIAGEDGALPGIVMLADPMIGDVYRQEWLLGEAEDGAEVLSLNETVVVPYGEFMDCLQTADFTPVEPDTLEYKFYAAGIGPIKELDVESGEMIELIDVIVE